MKKLVIGLTLGMLLGSAATALAATNETVQATFAKFVFKVNGQEKELKTTPLVVDGTSYLPVREISGLLGYELKYDEATREISLTGEPTKTTEPQPAVSEPKDGENMNTTAPKADEWIEIKELTEKYGVKATYGEKGTITNGNATLTFPLKAITVEDSSATIYLKSDTDSDVELKITSGRAYLRYSDAVKLGFIPAQ